jgi:hypothetical protein
MGLIKEPKELDFTFESVPWTEEELADFRKLMAELKRKNSQSRLPQIKTKKKKTVA